MNKEPLFSFLVFWPSLGHSLLLTLHFFLPPLFLLFFWLHWGQVSTNVHDFHWKLAGCLYQNSSLMWPSGVSLEGVLGWGNFYLTHIRAPTSPINSSTITTLIELKNKRHITLSHTENTEDRFFFLYFSEWWNIATILAPSCGKIFTRGLKLDFVSSMSPFKV